MNKEELTKADALNLITSVADNEATDNERKAFFDFIANDDEVRRKYQSLKNLKGLISERCPRATAPESLQNKVRSFIRSSRTDAYTGINAPIYDIPTGGPSRPNADRKTQFPIQRFSSPKYLG